MSFLTENRKEEKRHYEGLWNERNKACWREDCIKMECIEATVVESLTRNSPVDDGSPACKEVELERRTEGTTAMQKQRLSRTGSGAGSKALHSACNSILDDLKKEIYLKEAIVERQKEEIAKLKTQNQKLEYAVSHREAVISQLASSRKLVFEECHIQSLKNQTELRQMQEALHRVSRELQRIRRERASHRKTGSTNISRRGSPTSILESFPESLDWKSESDGEVKDLCDDDLTSVCSNEGGPCKDNLELPSGLTRIKTPTANFVNQRTNSELDNASESPSIICTKNRSEDDDISGDVLEEELINLLAWS